MKTKKKKKTSVNYIQKEGTDTFFAAQTMCKTLEKWGYPAPPIMAMEILVKGLHKRTFFYRRRVKQQLIKRTVIA